MKRTVLLIFAAAMLLASCQTKQSAIDDLRSFSRELQLNSEQYSFNDWRKAGKEYKEINTRIKKHAGDYNDAEWKEISELNGQCTRSFTEGAIQKAKGAAEMIKSFIGGILK